MGDSVRIFPFREMTVADKHKRAIDEAAARLIFRAANARGLEIETVSSRVLPSVEKYLIRDGSDVSTAEVSSFVDEIRADDLCLIIACEQNDEKAWEDLVDGFDSVVRSAARKIASNTEDADELASSIWAELYGLRQGEDGSRKSKLAYYSGRGSLAGWLRAIISQMAVDRFRKQSRLVQIEEAREFENLAEESSNNSNNEHIVSHAENPEEIYSEQQTADDVAEALQTAVASLEAEDRLILKMYYFDDLKLKDIAATFGYHEATASRKLVRVQNEIRKAVEKALKTRHGWSDGEVKKYLAETAAGLGISFEKMFAVLLLAAILQDFVVRNVL
ncbi:MAG TPA: sigma-70 family RNA polymerase sigma factor [Pyrinomonadaceae bacterium]|nr:sigma-70 family RNA polymerase sigma factor [Pyrinomonadaceae bacterium]